MALVALSGLYEVFVKRAFSVCQYFSVSKYAQFPFGLFTCLFVLKSKPGIVSDCVGRETDGEHERQVMNEVASSSGEERYQVADAAAHSAKFAHCETVRGSERPANVRIVDSSRKTILLVAKLEVRVVSQAQTLTDGTTR